MSGHPLPKLSVVVCTYNRPDRMRVCLASLVRQTAGAHTHEVIVVDNGSDEFHPGATPASEVAVRVLKERRPGVSRARNAGWQAARGDIVAYVDDDVEAAPDWAASVLAAFARVAPGPACIGGRVVPVWEAPPPGWLSDDLRRMLSLVDWSEVPRDLAPGEWAAGCNIAFTRDLLVRTGGFDEHLGRVGHRSLLSMEEVLMQARLRDLGHRIYYDPAVVVKHHIPAERLTPGWFLRRVYWNGVSHARLRVNREHPSFRKRARLAASAMRREVLRRDRLASLVGSAADTERFSRRCAAVGWLGYTLAMASLVRERGSRSVR